MTCMTKMRITLGNFLPKVHCGSYDIPKGKPRHPRPVCYVFPSRLFIRIDPLILIRCPLIFHSLFSSFVPHCLLLPVPLPSRRLTIKENQVLVPVKTCPPFFPPRRRATSSNALPTNWSGSHMPRSYQ